MIVERASFRPLCWPFIRNDAMNPRNTRQTDFDDETAMIRDYALFLRAGTFTDSEEDWRAFRDGFLAGGEAGRRWWARRRGGKSK